MNKPYLDSCQITPNPVNQKQTITIIMDIDDREIVFEKVVYYAGEIKAGEQTGVM